MEWNGIFFFFFFLVLTQLVSVVVRAETDDNIRIRCKHSHEL